jgi:hypothetical protein
MDLIRVNNISAGMDPYAAADRRVASRRSAGGPASYLMILCGAGIRQNPHFLLWILG